MAQEQGTEPEGQGLSLNLLLANALASLEQKRVEFPSLIAVLSLFNLFSVLNNPVNGRPQAEPAGLGGAELMGLLTGLLGGAGAGGAPGADMKKQGGNLNPQMLMSLLSLLSQVRPNTPVSGAIEGSPPAAAERRPGRGLI